MCVSAEAWPFTTFTATAIFLDSSTHARTRPNEPSPTYEKQLVLRKTSCSSQTSNQIWPPEIYWRSMIHKNHTAINPNWHYCCMLLSESGKSHGTTYPPTSLVTLHLHGFSVSKVFPVCSCVAFFFTTYLPELPNFIPRVHWKCGVSRFHLPEWHGNQTKESMCKREMERPWQRRKMIKDDAKMTNTNPKFKSKGHLSPCEKNMRNEYVFQCLFQSFSAKHRSCEFSLSSVRCSPDTVKSLQDFVDSVTAFPLPLAFPSRLRLRSSFSSASSSPATWRMGESIPCRVLPTKSTRGSTNWCVKTYAFRVIRPHIWKSSVPPFAAASAAGVLAFEAASTSSLASIQSTVFTHIRTRLQFIAKLELPNIC